MLQAVPDLSLSEKRDVKSTTSYRLGIFPKSFLVYPSENFCDTVQKGPFLVG